MPELPEVETIRKGLERVLIRQKINSVDVRVKKLFNGNSEELKNQTITEINRRAKILIIRLSNSVLLIHLKMTGQLIYVPKIGKPVIGGHPDKVYSMNLPHKHSHIIFELSKGTLFYNDLRKFGWIKMFPDLESAKEHFSKLGTEYTWPEYTLKYLKEKLAKRQNITIKQALLEQSLVAGIGNIYADETLFITNIRPTRKVSSLNPTEIKKIYITIPKVFNLSLKHGGTSAKDYIQPDGKMGTYLKVANVYKREGEPCKVCGEPIERIKISGRSSHYCPRCQK